MMRKWLIFKGISKRSVQNDYIIVFYVQIEIKHWNIGLMTEELMRNWLIFKRISKWINVQTNSNNISTEIHKKGKWYFKCYLGIKIKENIFHWDNFSFVQQYKDKMQIVKDKVSWQFSNTFCLHVYFWLSILNFNL